MDEIIFGIHAVKSALNYLSDDALKGETGAAPQVSLLLVDRGRKDSRINALVELARKKSVKVTFVQRKKLDELCHGNHQGVVAQSSTPKVKSESFLDELLQGLNVPPFLLVLFSLLPVLPQARLFLPAPVSKTLPDQPALPENPWHRSS